MLGLDAKTLLSYLRPAEMLNGANRVYNLSALFNECISYPS